jgi:hypothetical protein
LECQLELSAHPSKECFGSEYWWKLHATRLQETLTLACSAIFQYSGFNVVYESGIDNIPRFDAHIEVISQDKSVKIQYDTPYVKGLPTNIYISENDNGVYKETNLRVTYEDSYTQEMMELYEWYTAEKDLKTTVSDSKDDVTIFGMLMKAL